MLRQFHSLPGLISALLVFGFALSWVGVAAGAAVRTPEALQGIIFAVVFPLTFVSSAFVPVNSLPEWIQPFAENQPFSVVVNAVINGEGNYGRLGAQDRWLDDNVALQLESDEMPDSDLEE